MLIILSDLWRKNIMGDVALNLSVLCDDRISGLPSLCLLLLFKKKKVLSIDQLRDLYPIHRHSYPYHGSACYILAMATSEAWAVVILT